MPILNEFEYVRPNTLDEAIHTLSRFGAKASVLAGGTDLVNQLADDLIAPEIIVDIKGIVGLKKITLEDGKFSIGAGVTFAEIIESEIVTKNFPVLVEASKKVASLGIRNRATLVGNICMAVPSCDGGPPLLVYEADVIVRCLDGERKIPIEDWFVGPKKTALGDSEIVTAISIPIMDRRHGGCYVKLGRYRGEDLAQASVAIMAIGDRTYRVAFGAVAPTPIRGRRIEAAISGATLDDAVIEKCKGLLLGQISPITDIRSTAEYRMHMVGVMLERGLKVAAARLEGSKLPPGDLL